MSLLAANKGLICVTSSALLFGVVAAIVKFVDLPALVALQLRSIVQWILALAALTWRMNSGDTDGEDWPSALFGSQQIRHWVALRAVLYWVFIVCWWSALTYAPLGDATAIVYTAPLWTSFFATMVLGEKLSPHFPQCMFLSLSGLLLITRPVVLFGCTSTPCDKSGTYAKGALYALLSAFVAGLLPMCVRLSKSCHWATVEHTSAFVASFILTPVGLCIEAASLKDNVFSGKSFSSHNMAWLSLVSLIGFSALALQTYGYQREEASKASMMTFLEIPFAYMIQCIFFKQQITALGVLGIFLVVVSAVVNAYFRILENVSEAQKFAPRGYQQISDPSKSYPTEAVPLQAVEVDCNYESSYESSNEQEKMPQVKEREKEFRLRQSESEYTFVESTDDSV